MEILFKLFGTTGKEPTRKYSGDAGYDLYTSKSQIVMARSFLDINTDVAVALPSGLWARITGRSSTVRKYGLQVQEGIIDNGYRGELFVGVWNLTDQPVEIPAGSRIAQLILHHIVECPWKMVEQLPDSDRGSNGFGSSGR